MRDALSWSLPLGRAFGIAIRVHILFLMVAAGVILRAWFTAGQVHEFLIACGMVALLFASVVLHEFGHCFGARMVDGDATEILIWPLGGLAYVEVPHTPRANLLTTLAGPLVNVLLCVLSGAVLIYFRFNVLNPINPKWDFYNDPLFEQFPAGVHWLARFFYVNWMLFLLNMILLGFPMDGARVVQCLLWPRFGFREATGKVVFLGFVTAIILGVCSIVVDGVNAVLLLMLALFIYYTSRQQYIILESGGEDSLFGYDFSQGYTSLERDQPPAPRRPNFVQRWLQRRAARKLQEEMERREAEDLRMDALLDKVKREGLHALTEEEHRFLTRVSAKYRHRQ
jgi:Zn-dependent protease